MIDKITIAITLPINGAPWDRQAAISEAISAASMRGDMSLIKRTLLALLRMLKLDGEYE